MSVVTDRRWWNRETTNGRRSSCAHTFKPDRIEIDDDDDDYSLWWRWLWWRRWWWLWYVCLDYCLHFRFSLFKAPDKSQRLIFMSSCLCEFLKIQLVRFSFVTPRATITPSRPWKDHKLTIWRVVTQRLNHNKCSRGLKGLLEGSDNFCLKTNCFVSRSWGRA